MTGMTDSDPSTGSCLDETQEPLDVIGTDAYLLVFQVKLYAIASPRRPLPNLHHCAQRRIAHSRKSHALLITVESESIARFSPWTAAAGTGRRGYQPSRRHGGIYGSVMFSCCTHLRSRCNCHMHRAKTRVRQCRLITRKNRIFINYGASNNEVTRT